MRQKRKRKRKDTAEEDAPFLLVTHVNKILHSMFSNVKCTSTISNFTTLMDCMRTSYIYNNFKGAISEYKGVLHCEGCNYEEFPNEITEAPLSEPFFTRRMKLFSRPDGFILYGKLRVDFFLHFRNVISKYEN